MVVSKREIGRAYSWAHSCQKKNKNGDETAEAPEAPETPETPETPFQYHFDSGMGMYFTEREDGGVVRWSKFLLKTVSEYVS